MAKRFYTFIIVPNASSRLHKVRIPVQVMYVLAAIGFISFFVAVGLGFNYTKMAFRMSDYNQLQTENLELKVQEKNLQISTKKLDNKLANLENLSQHLTSLIENDEFVKRFAKNGKGGTKVDYPTSEIIRRAGQGDDLDSLKARASELESEMLETQQLYENRAKRIRFMPNIWPLKGRVGSSFGVRMDPFTGEQTESHLGIDISGLYGSPVHAPAEGLVIFAARMSDYGNLVIIDHGNGITTRYGHLSRFAARVGQHVNRGDVVGYVGTTGRTTAPHLHYEVRVNDRAVNPTRYLPSE